jgi:hypothetical protein
MPERDLPERDLHSIYADPGSDQHQHGGSDQYAGSEFDADGDADENRHSITHPPEDSDGNAVAHSDQNRGACD